LFFAIAHSFIAFQDILIPASFYKDPAGCLHEFAEAAPARGSARGPFRRTVYDPLPMVFLFFHLQSKNRLESCRPPGYFKNVKPDSFE
jgi:hypothetical protein